MKWIYIVISFFCFFTFFFFTLGVAEKPVSYPIKWENVPSISPEQRNLESPYLGGCMCDMTWGLCDPNCCCDTDCTAEERGMFVFCLQESFNSFPLEFCHKKNISKAVFRSSRRYIDKRNRAHKAVCIFRTNHIKELIPFFLFPKKLSKQSKKISTRYSEKTHVGKYVVNGGLLLLRRVEVDISRFEMRSIGLLRIPSAARDGYCVLKGRHVRFINPIDSTSCVLRGGDVCGTLPVSFYGNLFLATPGNFSSQFFTPMDLEIFDAMSGELLFSVDSDLIIPTKYQSFIDGNVCKNAVVRVLRELQYTLNGSGLALRRAITKLYIRNIETEDTVSLFFQVRFFRFGSAPLLNFFSAVPGYLPGSRLRAGTVLEKDGKKAILERVAGFLLPSGGRSCYDNNYRKVAFLHDVRSSGCTVLISEEELRKICSGTGTGKILRNILSINAKGSFEFDGVTKPIDHVARTNDALTNDTTSWIRIEGLDFDEISPNPYDSVNRECSNIYVGIHYRFTLTRVGALSNPQNVIVAAFAEPIIGKWKIQNTSDFSLDAVSAQKFRFLVSFAWLHSDSQTAINHKVLPVNILPDKDDTIFYPFKDSS